MTANSGFFERLGLGDLTGNIQTMPARAMPIDMYSISAITCGG